MAILALGLYLVLSAILLVRAVERPVWAVGYYLLNYFAQPPYWYWGNLLAGSIRWSLIAGCVLLASVWFSSSESAGGSDKSNRRPGRILVLLLLNATLVQFLLADNWSTDLTHYSDLAKLVLLFFLIPAAIRSIEDFRLLLVMLVLGLIYWGFEARFGPVQIVHARLEGFGGPGCSASNELASIVVTLLPIVGGMLFLTQKWTRVVVVLAAGLGLNTFLMCNSRAGFLAAIAAAFVILLLARYRLRRKALRGLAWGGIALFLLLGNPFIMERFLTTFYGAEDAEQSARARMAYQSAHSRKYLWKAGLSMVRDHPLGSGGDSFRSGKGNPYLAAAGIRREDRSVHQGFLRDACDWGVQGLALRLAFVMTAAVCAYQTYRFRQSIGDNEIAFLGICIIASIVAWQVTCLFGDMLHLEWGYWITAIAVIFARLYGPTRYTQEREYAAEEIPLERERGELQPVS